jgi:hypothetical protein
VDEAPLPPADLFKISKDEPDSWQIWNDLRDSVLASSPLQQAAPTTKQQQQQKPRGF